MADPAAPAPSPLLERWLPELRDAAPVLDLACGRGRNALAAARHGLRTVAVDRDAPALRGLADTARSEGLPLTCLQADLETGAPPPLRAASFGAVLVFRYLHRPLADAIARLLRPGGWLLYETFTTAQRGLAGGPRSDAFLLRPGELPSLFPTLRVVHFEEGVGTGPRPQALARLVARAAT